MDLHKFDLLEIEPDELMHIDGGGFAYDVGWFWRSVYTYVSNGGSGMHAYAVGAVAADIVQNYDPVN